MDTIKLVTALICITILEVVNLVYYGIDGAILVFIVSVLAGLVGYKIGSIRIPSEKELESVEVEK